MYTQIIHSQDTISNIHDGTLTLLSRSFSKHSIQTIIQFIINSDSKDSAIFFILIRIAGGALVVRHLC